MPRMFTRMPRDRIACSADVARCCSQENFSVRTPTMSASISSQVTITSSTSLARCTQTLFQHDQMTTNISRHPLTTIRTSSQRDFWHDRGQTIRLTPSLTSVNTFSDTVSQFYSMDQHEVMRTVASIFGLNDFRQLLPCSSDPQCSTRPALHLSYRSDNIVPLRQCTSGKVHSKVAKRVAVS